MQDEVLGELRDAVTHARYLRPDDLSHCLAIKLLQDVEERYLEVNKQGDELPRGNRGRNKNNEALYERICIDTSST